GAVIEANVVLGDAVTVGPNCVIGQNSRVGSGTTFRANVTVYHGVIIGQRCNFHSGVVLGADGFGFAPDKGRWHKIAQIGTVEIGDDVDVGANTTIDRGALENTQIGTGVILDNQIQIAHNCVIGDFTAIAGCTGIAGSTRIGKHCMIAGGVGIAGHLEICDRVHLMMMCQVTRSITEPGAYASGTAFSEEKNWKKSVARFRHLDELARRIQQLERELTALRGPDDKIL
ncbi:MAG TPA: UDP-3-O-(3-hydroxymyristoyl)glucosamine N-acyltransferase, partial [Pseudomonadales bacterium]|nr:UDP-3-O-(3-hydroxymyristoyl)glucosamine N-acyltransferase [Pseudomonadales bacterium]